MEGRGITQAILRSIPLRISPDKLKVDWKNLKWHPMTIKKFKNKIRTDICPK